MAISIVDRLFGLVLSVIPYSFIHYHHNGSRSDHHHKYDHNHNHNHKMKKGRPLSLETIDLKVRMCCAGCERVVKDAIYKLRGVDSVEVNLEMEKVTVTGYVERNKVLKAVRRSGKRAEFWPYPNPPLYFTSTNHYFKDTTTEFKESYNYWRHGYNIPDKHGTLLVTQRGDDKVSNMFNDDNVNACSVM